MTTSNTNKISKPKVCRILGYFKALDLEWEEHTHRILAASFVDSLGHKRAYLNKGSEIALIEKIIIEILESDYTIGWNTSSSIDKGNTDSTFTEGNNKRTDNVRCDFGILYERCEANGIWNIVSKSVTTNRTYYRINGPKHIDLYQVYSKQLVQDTVYSGKYRTHKLNDVAQGLLGYGKFKGFSGADFLILSISNRKKYVLRDSELVMDLSKHNNYELLDAMLAIAEITGLEFDHVCRTNLTTWWGRIFDKMIENGECRKPFHHFNRDYAKRYKGALVLVPKPGLYYNVKIVDARSLYPSMALVQNLSFETINCKCCRHNKNAKIKIDEKYFEGCKYISKRKCWICQRIEGAFAKKLRIFRKEKFEQEKLGNKAKVLALKLLSNGGYGCFGHPKFKYYNPYVAEFVTTFGRYTLNKMQSIARKLGFELLYGDTDSLFLNNPPSEKLLVKYMDTCVKQLIVEQETKKTYRKMLLSAGAKHYIGIGVDNKGKEAFDIVGFEGKKNDRCEFFQNVFTDIVNCIFKTNKNPVPKVIKAFSDLESGKVKRNLLKISKRLNQETYDKSNQLYQVAQAVGATKGDVVEFFSADKRATGKSWTLRYKDIDILHYKQMLWNTIDEVLELAGYSVQDLAKKFGVRIVGRRNHKLDELNDHEDATSE